MIPLRQVRASFEPRETTVSFLNYLISLDSIKGRTLTFLVCQLTDAS